MAFLFPFGRRESNHTGGIMMTDNKNLEKAKNKLPHINVGKTMYREQKFINNASNIVIENVNIGIAQSGRMAYANGHRLVATIVHRLHQYVVFDDLHFSHCLRSNNLYTPCELSRAHPDGNDGQTRMWIDGNKLSAKPVSTRFTEIFIKI